MTRNKLINGWDEFLESVRNRFGPSKYEDPQGTLSKLLQIGTVAQYQSEFEKLMNRVTDISETLLISFFISGLKPTLQRELLVAKPTTLGEAFSLAKVTEAQLEDQRSPTVSHLTTIATGGGLQKQTTSRLSGAVTNMSKPLLLPTPTAATTQPSPKPLAIKWISPAERHERINKGLCFIAITSGYVVISVQVNSFLLMADDVDDLVQASQIEEEEDVVESGDISILNSLISQGSPCSLQLWGKIGTSNVHVLIDNGRMHNFVQPDVVEQMRLPIQATKAFKVYIGSGETLLCENMCVHVTLQMQEQTMEFTLSITTYALKRDESLRMKRISLHRMQALLDAEDVYGVYEFHSLPMEAEDQVTSHRALDTKQELDSLLSLFASLFQVPTNLPPHRLIDHRIHLLPNTKPVNVRPYRYPHYQKREMEKLVMEMLSQGIIRFSHSLFSSPVLLVKKKDGSYRFCVDYRALNAVTVKDKFPIPMADKMFDELGGTTIFTKLDLRARYHQIRVHERDVYKTAFRTHDGHYEFLVMPFGLTNAPSTFQATMNRLFSSYLRKFIIVFFDDILVYSTTLNAHLEHLEFVFQCLREHQFYIKQSKCVFGEATLEYLGHIISGCGVEMNPNKVAVIHEWPIPTNQRQVRGFLGLVGYYRRFIQGYATVATPLTDLFQKDRFKWGETETKVFEDLKQHLSRAPCLGHPDFEQTFVVEADASGDGIGVLLLQDHRPVADALSRMYEDVHQVTAAFMSLSQPLVGLMGDVKGENESLEEKRQLHQKMDRGEIPIGFRRENGLLIYQDRYYIGLESRLKTLLLREFHDTPGVGHGEIKKMLVGLSALFYWKRMRKSVEGFIKLCLVCQQTKYSTQVVGGYLQPLSTPTAVWEDVSMDFITGLPVSKGVTVILVMVDRFTKYAHFGVLPTNFTAHKVAEVFLEVVVKHHGVTKTIVSDRDLETIIPSQWNEAKS
ncbi:ty3-gypsy retrotransposon protein [Tanacetum coccineum]